MPKKDVKGTQVPRHPGTVAILMGSDSDWPTFEAATGVLKEFGVAHEVRVLSAHRTPEETRRFVEQAPGRGVRVFIAGAGGAAHLAGVVAAHTILPVIGVPVESKMMGGLDSLLSTVQMPRGVPVATVAIGNSANAAILAVQILAVHDEKLSKALTVFKQTLASTCLKADQELQAKLK